MTLSGGSPKLIIFSTSQGYWKVNETVDEKYLQKRLKKSGGNTDRVTPIQK